MEITIFLTKDDKIGLCFGMFLIKVGWVWYSNDPPLFSLLISRILHYVEDNLNCIFKLFEKVSVAEFELKWNYVSRISSRIGLFKIFQISYNQLRLSRKTRLKTISKRSKSVHFISLYTTFAYKSDQFRIKFPVMSGNVRCYPTEVCPDVLSD